MYCMAELKNEINADSEYIRIPKHFTVDGKNETGNIEFRIPHGEALKDSKGRRLIAPYNPDLPIESGFQLQLLDLYADTNQQLGQSPLLSDEVSPSRIVDLARIGIAAEEFLVTKTDQAWANFNFHSRPPMNPVATEDAQYNQLTLDIHGRDISDERNWTRPPAVHGGWGLASDVFNADQARRDLEWMTDHKTDVAELRKIEDEQKRWGQDIIPHPANPLDFAGWENHPSGYYFEGGRRQYTYKEMKHLKRIYKGREFERRIETLDALPLFQGEIVVNMDFHHSEHFPANDTDLVLFEASFGERHFQVVTQKTPLVDRKDGIHMVVKLRPEPHTPWDHPTQTLEAVAIGIGLSRIFQKEKLLEDDGHDGVEYKSDGEIGDVYLDMNANWSMTKKQALLEDLTLPEIKEAIQKDTRAHLHVQLEKMDAKWEIPPAPGTFTGNEAQPSVAIDKMRTALNDKEKGLLSWISDNFLTS